MTLANDLGLSVRILSLGAAIHTLHTPDRDGRSADVVLGFDTAAQYAANREYFGVTLGRYANRIANGRFALDGKHYQLATNDGRNALHGGWGGFSRALWTIADVRSGAHAGAGAGVTMTLVSPHGDDGYPGRLAVTASFDLIERRLEMRYRATADRPTIVNLSNHTYFNLTGSGGADHVLGHVLTIPADDFLPIDDSGIPTGEWRAVEGSAFDFRRPVPIGRRIRDVQDAQIRIGKGYDHCWAIRREPGMPPVRMAQVWEPESGRALEVASTQPGLQFYTGNFLDGSPGKGGIAYGPAAGFSLEPQLFPDTPNQPALGSARLDPGGLYEHTLIYRFGVP